MITWMQKHRKYLVVTIWISTIAFVGAGFVGWGAYNYNLNKAGAVSVVGDRKITIKELNQAYSNMFNYYQEQSKGKFTREKAKEMGLEKIALYQLENDALLLNYADEIGLNTLDSEIEKVLKNTKAFQKNGVFNKDQYYRVLKNIQMSAKDYEESLRKEITLKKLNNILSLKPTKLEIDTFGASMFMEDRLLVKIITANANSVKVNDEELKNFWEKRKDKYLSVKSYKLDIIKIPVSFINVDENESKDYYKKKRYAYTDKDGKIESYEQAKERVYQDIRFKKGKRFALKKYLALKKGKEKPQESITVDINDKNYPQDKLKKASKGEVIKPFRYKDMYIVAKVIDINLPKPLNFIEAKKLVKKDFTKIAEKNILEKNAKEALNNFKNGKDIGFIGRDDIKKVKGLNEFEAINFLDKLFKTNSKKGYQIFDGKAIVYKIVEQKLLDKDKLKTYDILIKNNVKNAKAAEENRKLLAVLREKYSIQRYIKGQ